MRFTRLQDILTKGTYGMKQRFSIILIVLVISCSPLAALESVDIHTGILYIGNPVYEPASVDGKPTGGPSPFVNVVSLSLPLEMGQYFRFATEFSLYGTQYGLIPGYAKVVPVEREFADAIWFLGVILDLSFWIDIPLSDSLGLGFNLGPSVVARAPIAAWGTGWEELETMALYLYDQGRFFYPEAGFFLNWRPPQLDFIEVSLRGRAYFPVFHIWDNEGVSFLDQFIATGSLGIRIYPSRDDSSEESP